MSNAPFWPCDICRTGAGLDYQGRYPQFADTIPTQPAPLEARPGLHLVITGDHGAAHTHSGITSDSDRDDDKPGQGAGVLLVPACFALALVSAWALYAWLSAPL